MSLAMPMCQFLAALVALVSLTATFVQAISATGQRVLIVLGNQDQPVKYSSFIADLKLRGFQVSQRVIDQAQPQLRTYGERQFDHIVFLADDVQNLPHDLSPQTLVDFNKEGGNIVFSYSPEHSDWLRDLARQYSFEIPSKSYRLVDHFNYAIGRRLDDGTHSTIAVGGHSSEQTVTPNEVIFSPSTLAALRNQPLLFGNISPHLLGQNPLALPLVTPPSTSYVAKEGKLAWLGTEENLAIVSAFQLKDSSARVVFVGSKNFLMDEFIQATDFKVASAAGSQTLNRAFLADLTAWTFQEKGVLRVERRSHYRVRESADDIREPYEEPTQGGEAAMYRIKDTVRYSLDIAQHTPELGWIPAPKDFDLQVSLNMIDPFITVSLTSQGFEDESARTISTLDRSLAPQQSNSTTRYTAAFKLPDRLGVYTFRIQWRRHGWSFLDTRDVAPVRAFNHDEGPRFLPASWPYAAASFSTIGGFLLFTLFWLLSTEKQQVAKDEEKKSQ